VESRSERAREILGKPAPALLVLATIAIIAFHFIHSAGLTKFHADENIWIIESKYYKLLVIDGRSLSDFMQDPNGYDWVRSTLFDTACVVKRIFIMVSELFHRDMGSIDLPRWDFGRDERYNLDRGSVPSKDTLDFYRYISSSFAIAGCIILMAIGAQTSNIYGGMAAALFMAFHPLMVTSTTRAMAEGVLIFFITLCVYTMLMFVKYLAANHHGQAMVSAIATGIAAGLATGAKLNGGVVLAVFLVLCVVLFALRFRALFRVEKRAQMTMAKDRHLRVIVVSAVLAATIAISVFISIDPVLRIAPIRNSMLMLNHRIKTVKLQGPAFHSQLSGFQDRAAFIRKTVASDYPVLLFLYAGGAMLMLYRETRRIIRSGQSSFRLLVLLWFFVTFAALMCTLLLSWDRYVLPLVPSLSLMAGYPFSGFSRGLPPANAEA